MLNMSHNSTSSSYRTTIEPLKDSRGKQIQETDSNGNRYNVMLKRHNSNWNMQAEQQAAYAEASTKYAHRSSSGIQLAANQIYGAAYEAHVARALHRDPRFTDVQDQVRLVPKPPSNQNPYSQQELKDLSKQAGATLRSDFVAQYSGKYKNIECKSSDTAGYTSNQSHMLSDIKNRGAVVVSDRGNYYRGDNLGKVGTVTVRPGSEDDIFEQEVLSPASPPKPKPAPRQEDPIWGRRW